MNGEKFHIGHQIERVINQRRMMKCMLADKVGLSNSAVIRLRERKDIGAHLLQQLGKALGYNFFKHYPVEEAQADACARVEIDKDKLIEEQAARIAELQRQLEEMKQLEMQYLKQGYEDLRQANEMLMSSLRKGSAPSRGKVARRNLFG